MPGHVRFALAAALGMLALGGCGGSGGAPGGEQLIVARVKDAVGLDPAHQTDGLSLNISSEIFENLVRFKPGRFDVLPGIAESWHSSADGTVWTFKLRHGLKFTDGTPLNRTFLSPTVPASSWGNWPKWPDGPRWRTVLRRAR